MVLGNNGVLVDGKLSSFSSLANTFSGCVDGWMSMNQQTIAYLDSKTVASHTLKKSLIRSLQTTTSYALKNPSSDHFEQQLLTLWKIPPLITSNNSLSRSEKSLIQSLQTTTSHTLKNPPFDHFEQQLLMLWKIPHFITSNINLSCFQKMDWSMPKQQPLIPSKCGLIFVQTATSNVTPQDPLQGRDGHFTLQTRRLTV